MMGKITKTVMLWALVLFVVSITDVFAVDTTKLERKEFKVSGLAKKYDSEGYQGSGQITQGIVYFFSPEGGAWFVHNIASDILMSVFGGYPELYCYTALGPYTPGVDKIRSETCTMNCYSDPASGGDPVLTYDGSCTAKIVFTSNTTFTGTITLPDFWDPGCPYVLTLDGKFVGRYPVVGARGTSLHDALKERAPEGLRKLFRR